MFVQLGCQRFEHSPSLHHHDIKWQWQWDGSRWHRLHRCHWFPHMDTAWTWKSSLINGGRKEWGIQLGKNEFRRGMKTRTRQAWRKDREVLSSCLFFLNCVIQRFKMEVWLHFLFEESRVLFGHLPPEPVKTFTGAWNEWKCGYTRKYEFSSDAFALSKQTFMCKMHVNVLELSTLSNTVLRCTIAIRMGPLKEQFLPKNEFCNENLVKSKRL